MLGLIIEYLVPGAAVLAVLVWFVFQIVVVARGPIPQCWQCSGRRIRNARRRGPERFLPAFISPRRCERCAARFYSLISVNYPLRAAAEQDEDAGLIEPDWKPAFTRSSKEVT
jgi:hypothetical protein